MFGPTSMYEIEDNIILFGGYMKLDLIDINNNETRYLQKLTFNGLEGYIQKLIKLSNGQICLYYTKNILFYKYNINNKNLEKIGEIITKSEISELFETNDGKIITFFEEEIIIYDKNKSVQTIIKINKNFTGCDVIDKYIFIYYHYPKDCIYIYNLKDFTIKQIVEVKYSLRKIIKLNENLLIAYDWYGNIHELNMDKNFEISVTDLFRAHDYNITHICKFDNNKALSISQDGNARLWEFN